LNPSPPKQNAKHFVQLTKRQHYSLTSFTVSFALTRWPILPSFDN